MDKRLGIHLGRDTITAVALTSDGAVQDQVSWRPSNDQDHWHYSASDIQTLCDYLNERFDPRRFTMAVSLPVEAVFFRRVEMPESDEARDEAVRYAAEPLLPLPLDKLHLVIRRRGDYAEVLAVQTEPWGRVLEALDEAGWLCPKALCDAEAFVQSVAFDDEDGGRPVLLSAVDSRRGIAGVRDGQAICSLRPFGISSATDAFNQELERTARSACGDRACATRVWESESSESAHQNASPADTKISASLSDLLPPSVPPSINHLAAWQAASSIENPHALNLRGGGAGEFRSTPIQRRTRRWVMAHALAAAVMLLMFAGALIFRGNQLQSRAAAHQASSQQIWAQLFPDRPPPRDIVSLLVSEQVRERGLREAAGAVPDYQPALDVLDRLLAGLPKNVRLRVQQIELTDGTSVITGQARGHGKVERLAAGISEAEDLTVEPPRTRRTDAGPVRFTLRFHHEQPKTPVNPGKPHD